MKTVTRTFFGETIIRDSVSGKIEITDCRASTARRIVNLCPRLTLSEIAQVAKREDKARDIAREYAKRRAYNIENGLCVQDKQDFMRVMRRAVWCALHL